MRTRTIVRTAATGLLVLLVAVPASQEVAGANDTPPPTTTTIPAPPVSGQGNARACELAYAQVRAEVISEFRARVQAALNSVTGLTDLEAVAAAVIQLNEELAGTRAGLIECLTRVLPDGAPRLGTLAAKPKHRGGGGGGGSSSSCLSAFDKAVKKATRTEDRSFRKKHHTVSPDVAAVTFDTAVASAAQRLQSCLAS